VGSDVCIVEVGGTVGDIEGMPYLEALRQFAIEQDDEDVLFAHVTLVPYSKNGEQKTKPTQHSVKELRSIGLRPDIVVGRCSDHLEQETREKIALFCDVPQAAVFSNPDVEDIYRVPLELEEEGLDEFVLDSLGLRAEALSPAESNTEWRDRVTRAATETVTVAVVGKYGLEDAYISVHEALKHGGLELGVDVEREWVHAETLADGCDGQLAEIDAVVVPGGFGSRGTEGKIRAIQQAREQGVPFLGLCLGFQMAVVEYARNVLGLTGAHSAELDESTPHPVIDILPEQEGLDDMGGTMRLGTHTTDISDGTLAHDLYGDDCEERHRHRYEVNPDYIPDLEAAGLVFSGQSGRRMELVELPAHPYFVGTQFHPEFRSRPTRASPPFVGLLDAALDTGATTTQGVSQTAGGGN
jgi:CTP synthase (EC 6.3.4.2)